MGRWRELVRGWQGQHQHDAYYLEKRLRPTRDIILVSHLFACQSCRLNNFCSWGVVGK